MPLSAGTHFGSYEILSLVGAGGMGEVYQARDTKLGRQVAIKILPEAFAKNPERLARFEREARLLASLNPDVGWLEVAVNDALLMSGFQSFRDLFEEGECLTHGNGSASEPLGQRFAGHELHDEKMNAVRLLEPVKRGDVGV